MSHVPHTHKSYVAHISETCCTRTWVVFHTRMTPRIAFNFCLVHLRWYIFYISVYAYVIFIWLTHIDMSYVNLWWYIFYISYVWYDTRDTYSRYRIYIITSWRMTCVVLLWLMRIQHMSFVNLWWCIFYISYVWYDTRDIYSVCHTSYAMMYILYHLYNIRPDNVVYAIWNIHHDMGWLQLVGSLKS